MNPLDELQMGRRHLVICLSSALYLFFILPQFSPEYLLFVCRDLLSRSRFTTFSSPQNRKKPRRRKEKLDGPCCAVAGFRAFAV